MNTTVRAFMDRIRFYIEHLEWRNEARLIGSAMLLAGIIIYTIPKFSELFNAIAGSAFSRPSPRSREACGPPMTAPRNLYVCGAMRCPYDSTVRTNFGDLEVSVYAWPSRGGVIILNHADAMDFEFLGLDPLDPPIERFKDQTEEDIFSQRLLLLGAKWWDSEARYTVIAAIEHGRPGDGSFVAAHQPPATMREKRFVKVAWPSTGGLWVAEYDTVFAGVDEEDNLLPEAPSRLHLARTMDERSRILRDNFGATFYKSLEDYQGYAFLRTWKDKSGGEAGPLLQPHETIALWKRGYSRPR